MPAQPQRLKPGYPATKRKMKARSRAYTRLARIHRAEFLALFDEELAFIEAEEAREAAAPPQIDAALEDYQFVGGDKMSIREAAERLRVTTRTVVRYRERLREAS